MDNKKRKRKIIIEVAMKLFVERGFHGTPTSLIAKEAGIATGTLFNYFKTKNILINEIFIEIKLEQKEGILKDLEEAKTSKMKLKKIWNNLIIWGIKNPEERKFINYFANSNFISDGTKTEVQKNYKFLLDIFRGIIKKKGMKNVDELMLILNFMGACVFTGKYFHITNEVYDEKLSNEPFERFCKSIDLGDED
ncbi:MAG: TetR/AcrR family transcriptional regulator [Psychrilyobacter sp.]|uniref:TetR/AcrR family transcriptional regulator n=1 Tax=Psychrilyobacter sp. TaxID=2586924 RepID=UPI003C71FF03